jgi:molybdopterin/thiamine biosynthesis adenylyltransferase
LHLPRVKPEHDAKRMADGSIRLGRRCVGIAAELEDPTGAVWILIEAMDGSRTADEIAALVAREHPGEAPELVRAAIADLIGSGYVEDCGGPGPAELTEREKERYSRCRSYFSFVDLVPRPSWWEPQVLLRNGRVTVVGLGGVGSHVALALAASGVGHLHCVDRDTVELSNLNRQILFTEHDIGRTKIEAGIDRLRQVNSDIQATGRQAEISAADDLAALAAGTDVLVLRADHPRDITRWTNRACIAAGIPWVDVGYHGPVTVMASYVPGQGPCWQCQRTAIHEESVLDGEPERGADALVLGDARGVPFLLIDSTAASALTSSSCSSCSGPWQRIFRGPPSRRHQELCPLGALPGPWAAAPDPGAAGRRFLPFSQLALSPQ